MVACTAVVTSIRRVGLREWLKQFVDSITTDANASIDYIESQMRCFGEVGHDQPDGPGFREFDCIAEQKCPLLTDRFQILSLIGLIQHFAKDINVAQNGGHRRPNFVTHVGQEFATTVAIDLNPLQILRQLSRFGINLSYVCERSDCLFNGICSCIRIGFKLLTRLSAAARCSCENRVSVSDHGRKAVTRCTQRWCIHRYVGSAC